MFLLKTIGFEATELKNAQSLLRKQLTQFFIDPIGQWLIQAHNDERNEYELLVNDKNNLQTKIIAIFFSFYSFSILCRPQ